MSTIIVKVYGKLKKNCGIVTDIITVSAGIQNFVLISMGKGVNFPK